MPETRYIKSLGRLPKKKRALHVHYLPQTVLAKSPSSSTCIYIYKSSTLCPSQISNHAVPHNRHLPRLNCRCLGSDHRTFRDHSLARFPLPSNTYTPQNINSNLGPGFATSLQAEISSEVAAGSAAATAGPGASLGASIRSGVSSDIASARAAVTATMPATSNYCGDAIVDEVLYTGACTGSVDASGAVINFGSGGPTAAATGATSTGGAPRAIKTAGAMLGAGAVGVAALLI
jgi:hypothetical protein